MPVFSGPRRGAGSALWGSELFRPPGPVEDNGNGGQRTAFVRDREEKSSVGRDRIKGPHTGRPDPRLEQGSGIADLERWSRRGNLYGHQQSTRSDEVEFLSACPPSRHAATVGRNLMLDTGSRKWPDVNLISA